MCETVETCKRGNTWWVQSRREIQHPGNPDLGVEPFRSGVSVMACARHLSRAVREIGEKNRDAADGMHRPATDGVIVKTHMPDGSWR